MAAAPVFNFWNPFSSSSSAQDKDKAAPAAAQTSGFQFRSGVYLKPHDDKVYKGGEDAYAITDTLISVADGVGGWADRGVDPGLFSKQLCKDIQSLYV